MRNSCILVIAAALALSACSTTGQDASSVGNAAPATLQGGEWTVEDIGGRGIIDNSHVTLHFGSDGALAGSATCNRLIATYAAKDSSLTIIPSGLTMMACPAALMVKDRRFVDLLNEVKRFRIDETGALVLETAGGKTITARR